MQKDKDSIKFCMKCIENLICENLFKCVNISFSYFFCQVKECNKMYVKVRKSLNVKVILMFYFSFFMFFKNTKCINIFNMKKPPVFSIN